MATLGNDRPKVNETNKFVRNTNKLEDANYCIYLSSHIVFGGIWQYSVSKKLSNTWVFEALHIEALKHCASFLRIINFKMATMRDRKGCFPKNGEVKHREIVAKNMKRKSNKLLEVRDNHNPNSDLSYAECKQSNSMSWQNNSQIVAAKHV